ncbi:NAD(P)-dependent dehydrogenase, partial [Escherichia coli]
TAIPEIKDLTSEQFQQTFAVNVFALFWITQEAITRVKAQMSRSTICQRKKRTPSRLKR